MSECTDVQAKRVFRIVEMVLLADCETSEWLLCVVSKGECRLVSVALVSVFLLQGEQHHSLSFFDLKKKEKHFFFFFSLSTVVVTAGEV